MVVGIISGSGVGSMLRNYGAMSNSTSGSVSNNSRTVAGSLGDWARIKVDKKSGIKANTNNTTNATHNTHTTHSSNSGASGAYYSANPPMSANYEDSLAWALAASLADAYKALPPPPPNTTSTTLTAYTSRLYCYT